MKKITTLLTVALCGLGLTVQAAKITGSIDMSGTAFLDSTSLGAASAATSLTGVTVGGIPTGTFAPVPAGTAVAWNPFTWPSAVAVTPLWSFTFSGVTYSFDLNSVGVVSQDNAFLNLLGSGTLKATGSTDTTGTWSFTISNPGGGHHANFAFTFANSQTAVPDGGMTAMLLGGALSALAFIRRKF